MNHASSRAQGLLGAVLLLAAPSFAQCTNPWLATPGSVGVEGAVGDMLVFDPDGPGPIGERVLVAGSFAIAGAVLTNNLAVYDPALRTWTPFGAAAYPPGLQLARAANGDLYVGGNFSSIAGVSAANVARWDGTNWSALGAGVNGQVSQVEVRATGGVVLIGQFTQAGGAPTNGIAQWDGSSWSSLGSASIPSTYIRTVVEMPNGDLCLSVGVNTTWPGFCGVLRYDGVAWTPMGAFPAAPVSLLVLPSGDLLAGGESVPGGYAPQTVARWNGSVWTSLGNTPFQRVWRLAALSNGTVVAVGSPSSSYNARFAIWDGSNWTTLGDSYSYSAMPNLAVLASDEVLAAGNLSYVDNATVRGLARWNGATWSSASAGLAGSVRWLAVRPDGNLFAGDAYGLVSDTCALRWNGIGWTPIRGALVGSAYASSMSGLFALPGGSLVLGAQNQTNGLAPPIVQRWTGSAWTTLATAQFGRVAAAAELPNGDLVVGGQLTSLSGVLVNNIARYDGAAWSPLGTGLTQVVSTLAMAPTGELFALAGSSVMHWNGSVWAQRGLAISGAVTLVIGADGAPIVAGNLSGPDVVRWNGATWVPLGIGPAGPVQSLVVLPNGDVVAGPLVNSSNPARPLERWTGTSWSPLGGLVDGTVYALSLALNGDLLLGGDFSLANGAPRCRFARISTSCPATVSSFASGCTYSPPTLVPLTLPWLGGMSRTVATNFLPGAVAVVAYGLTANSTPLWTLLPYMNTPSCMLLVSPHVLVLAVPNAGRVQSDYLVPNQSVLLGATFHQQLLAFATLYGSPGVFSSNALALQIGSF